MAKYAIVENSTNLVVNIVEWNGDTTKWQPPTGHTAIRTGAAFLGDTWLGGTSFQRPDPDAHSNAILAEARQLAKQELANRQVPTTVAMRNALRILFGILADHRTKINGIIDHLNGQGSVPTKLPARTWQQFVASVRSQIDSEIDPEA